MDSQTAFMEKHLLFSTSIDLVRIQPSVVVYIQADGNYSTLKLANGKEQLVTMQLGQIEKLIANHVTPDDARFIRIGKSLIVNQEFISFINVPRQKLTLSDARTFMHELTASKDSLRQLKEYLEQEQ